MTNNEGSLKGVLKLVGISRRTARSPIPYPIAGINSYCFN
jgi:hypothetical protein